MKKIKIFAMIFAACVAMSGCGAGEEEISVRDVKIRADNFKTLGRVYFDDDAACCALSGTGLEFSFTGTECTVTVEGDSMAGPGNADSNARIGIYLNGERVVDDMIDQPSETYEVLRTDIETEAQIKIVKLSESANSTFRITGITLNGTAPKPVENNQHLIEFIGDSITCGYGVDDPDPNHHFSTRTEDCTKAYAYKTAEKLGADYSLVSYSGYGIISGYTGGDEPLSAQTVPQYYSKYGYSWSKNDSFDPASVEYDFKRQPDVVVINLGTNDSSYCRNIPERCEVYKSAYVDFLKDIRKNNPDSTIIVALGIMGQELYSYAEQAAADYTAETGDTNIASMMFDNQNQQTDGVAADWHPTESTHDKAAEKLAGFIREKMGW